MTLWVRSEAYQPEEGPLLGWLLTIARNRAIDRLRGSARRPLAVGLAPAPGGDGSSDEERLVAIGEPVGFGTSADEPGDLAERRWRRAVVRAALAGMPHAERHALELAYDEGLTQVEVAQRLGLPLGTVKTRTRRGLLRLRAMLASVPDIGPDVGRAADGLGPAGGLAADGLGPDVGLAATTRGEPR